MTRVSTYIHSVVKFKHRMSDRSNRKFIRLTDSAKNGFTFDGGCAWMMFEVNCINFVLTLFHRLFYEEKIDNTSGRDFRGFSILRKIRTKLS